MESKTKVIGFLVFLIMCLVAGCLVLNARINLLKSTYEVKLYEEVVRGNKVIQEARYADSVASRTKDSLSFLLSAKNQTIIINRYYYDSSNKAVAFLNDSAISVVYNQYLRSARKEYGYLLPN